MARRQGQHYFQLKENQLCDCLNVRGEISIFQVPETHTSEDRKQNKFLFASKGNVPSFVFTTVWQKERTMLDIFRFTSMTEVENVDSYIRR
jgi:hypothetical protein